MNKIINSLADMPDLNDCEVASPDLCGEYWTPDQGETRSMIYIGVRQRSAPDHNNPALSVTLDCAVFLEFKDGTQTTVINGSKRLVAGFQENNVQPGQAVRVEYKGKIKNATNAYMSDHWGVRFLPYCISGAEVAKLIGEVSE